MSTRVTSLKEGSVWISGYLLLLGVTLLAAAYIESGGESIFRAALILILFGIPAIFRVITIISKTFSSLLHHSGEHLMNLPAYSKRRWKTSLTAVISLLFVAVIFSFQLGPRVAAAVIAIMPAAIYYLYTEFLDQPSIKIIQAKKSAEWAIRPTILPTPLAQNLDGKPMSMSRSVGELDIAADSVEEMDPRKPEFIIDLSSGTFEEIDYRGQILVRPIACYRVSVTNEGKSTAERAHIQFRLEGSSQYTAFGRWEGHSNPQEYDLLPGQTKTVNVLKVFLFTNFYPSSDLIEFSGEFTENHLKNHGFPTQNFLGKPSGKVFPLPEVFSSSVNPYVQIPIEKRPEELDVSTIGAWEGEQVFDTNESYTISMRTIADNYKSDWKQIAEISIVEAALNAAAVNSNWTENWKKRTEHLKYKFQEAIEEHLSTEN